MSHIPTDDDARQAILTSIREHLAASRANDSTSAMLHASHQLQESADEMRPDLAAPNRSLIELFCENLEAVDGHCIVVENEVAVAAAVRDIISNLRESGIPASRIVLSDASQNKRLVNHIDLDFAELSMVTNPAAVFASDVGITSAQGAIAETGTLVLDSKRERHRLVSLLPPVHIAIIDADQICLTLGEVLEALQRREPELSSAITFITGPSRTADIELTLAIGVHGPQRLYVIVNTGAQAAA